MVGPGRRDDLVEGADRMIRAAESKIQKIGLDDDLVRAKLRHRRREHRLRRRSGRAGLAALSGGETAV